MHSMNRIDALDLDGRLLQLLVSVVEQRSVTRAAERLGLTQSAVSHGVERLRRLTGDPLFVKAGRGIAPTAHAEQLAHRARELIDGLHAFAAGPAFDPAHCRQTFCIAANPLQRDLLLPPLLDRLRLQAPGVSMRVLPSEVPTAERLRSHALHLVISPRLPEADDVRAELLLQDRYRVFYDASVRTAPVDRAAYEAAEHVTVRYPDDRSLDIDRFLAERGVNRRMAAQVSDFSGVAPFVRGTARLATLPALTALHLMRGLGQADVPMPCPPMPMHLIWHRRYDDDAMHRWMRQAVREVAAAVHVRS